MFLRYSFVAWKFMAMLLTNHEGLTTVDKKRNHGYGLPRLGTLLRIIRWKPTSILMRHSTINSLSAQIKRECWSKRYPCSHAQKFRSLHTFQGCGKLVFFSRLRPGQPSKSQLNCRPARQQQRQRLGYWPKVFLCCFWVMFGNPQRDDSWLSWCWSAHLQDPKLLGRRWILHPPSRKQLSKVSLPRFHLRIRPEVAAGPCLGIRKFTGRDAVLKVHAKCREQSWYMAMSSYKSPEPSGLWMEICTLIHFTFHLPLVGYPFLDSSSEYIAAAMIFFSPGRSGKVIAREDAWTQGAWAVRHMIIWSTLINFTLVIWFPISLSHKRS